MSAQLRNSGLPFVGRVPWEGYIHVFHETNLDLLDAVAPYFRAGLADNELCLFVPPDRVAENEILDHFSRAIPGFDKSSAGGRFDIVRVAAWLERYGPEPNDIIRGVHEYLRTALDRGHDGLRGAGNSFWLSRVGRKDFFRYERQIAEAIAGRPILGLSTYPLEISSAVDFLEVAKAHRVTMARRSGEWEILETPELGGAPSDSKPADNAAAAEAISRLTAREREVLMQLVDGQTHKKIGSALGISDRTVEVYRNRIMQKTGARNLAELVRLAVAGGVTNRRGAI
jgi:DNA-binding CsgD family transcriptional regulator